MDAGDRLKQFEAKLGVLKRRMEDGLTERALTLRELADRVEAGDETARKALKTEGHKLRGVAGSYGHNAITELAAELEQRASMSPPATVGRLARELADLAEAAREGGLPERGGLSAPPPPPPPGMSGKQKVISDRPRVTSSEGAALRVLAMDDDLVTQRLLKLTLREVGGFSAEIVGSAGEALELLQQQTFDVIVSDAMMPDMNGREFCAEARRRGVTTPIIILSAASPAELGWVSEVEGQSAWLRKPFKPSALVHDIARIVEQGR